MYIYIYIYTYTHIKQDPCPSGTPPTANLGTKTLDFGGFDSSRILI